MRNAAGQFAAGETPPVSLRAQMLGFHGRFL